MPVSYSSPARNLFLLGTTGQDVVTNFFDKIDRSSSGYFSFLPVEVIKNNVDEEILIGLNADEVSPSQRNFGIIEKRLENGTQEWETFVSATNPNQQAFLRDIHLDSNNNIIACGHSGGFPWIAKYSNGGVVDWQSTSSSGNVRYRGVTSDSNGQYYACGNTPISGEAQAFVEKFDASGNPGWGKSAFMLGRDVVLSDIAANDKGHVVAVGYLEDDSADKAYIIKIDTNTGEVLWDRTLSKSVSVRALAITIDDADEIYIAGVSGTEDVDTDGFVVKYTAEGNMLWQSETDIGSTTNDWIVFSDIAVDNSSKKASIGGYTSAGAIVISRYESDGRLSWRREAYQIIAQHQFASIDVDQSFTYFLFDDGLNQFDYTFGKVSATGNGLGDFEYNNGDGSGIPIQYVPTTSQSGTNITEKIGRLSDGSVRNDTSDLITYPFNANKLLFDDLATQVSNKKRQMDSPDSFEYSGSPAIRPADFLSKEYTTDGYGVPPQKNYIGLSETLQPTSTNANGTTNNTWSRQTTNVTVTANVIASPIGVGSMAEKYNISATTGRRLEYGVPSGVFVAGQTYTFSWWMKAITTNAEWNFQAYSAGNSNNSIRIADKDGNILENISTTNSVTYKPKDTEWHRVVWTFTANNTTGSPVGGYNGNSQTGDLWYLWGAQLVDGPDPLKYYRNYTNTPENAAGTEHAPSITAGATYSFDQTETLQIGEIPGDFSQMTVEIWFKSSTFSNWQNPIDCNYATQDVDGNGAANSGNVGPRLEINSLGQMAWYWGSSLAANDPKSASVITTISTNTWYHSVLSISGAGMGDAEFFLNGSSVGVNNGAGGGSWLGIIRNLVLGRGFALGGRTFNGEIGEVRIYPRALTAAQVFQNYNATKSKYINEAPDTAPKIGSGIVYDSNLLLNYDFGNRATYDRAENLSVYSEDFTLNNISTGWRTDAPQYSRATLIANTGIDSPVGTNNASRWQSGNNNNQELIYHLVPTALTIGETYTVSCWIRRVESFGPVRFYLGDNVPQDITTQLDAVPFGTWVRCSATYTITGANGTPIRNYVSVFPNGNVDGGDKTTIDIWGMNVNQGSTAGRYIKTYGSAITAPTTVKNLSSSSYTGTINGPTFNSAGYFEFDGAAGQIDLNQSVQFNTGDFSLCAWFKANSNPTNSGNRMIFGSGYAGSNPDIEFDLNGNGTARLYVRDANLGTSQVASPLTYEDDTWHHVVGVKTSSGCELYIDGVSVDSNTDALTGDVDTAGANSIIGNGTTGINNRWFDGSIGEFQAYTRALSSTEVSQNFNATRSKYGV